MSQPGVELQLHVASADLAGGELAAPLLRVFLLRDS
jgi:hypothetical protein